MPVNHPSEISEIFDEISYKKGGSIIRMMANFLGQDVFNRGIEEYLKKHKYGNAKQVRGYESTRFYYVQPSVTRLGDLLHFGQLFIACGNN